jgi:Flp pilus assembly protein TadG
LSKPRRTFQRGQELAEYALIFPLFLLLVLVIVDMGRATYYYSVVQNAAREGARAGVVLDPDDPLWEDKVEDAARQKAVGLHTDRTTVESSLTDQDPYLLVEVGVTYQFQPVSFIIGRLFGIGPDEYITLGSHSTMRAEW